MKPHPSATRRRFYLSRASLMLGVLLLVVSAIPAPALQPQQTSTPPEVQRHGAPPPFRIHAERNLVAVPVVVRDSHGHTVGNLNKEDFRLLDDGAPQEISGFTIETAAPAVAAIQKPASQPAAENKRAAPPPPVAPERFVGLFFDDFYLDPEGIGRTRSAAWKYVTTSVRPQDRVAIFTATGKDQLDFTADRDKLHDALFKPAP